MNCFFGVQLGMLCDDMIMSCAPREKFNNLRCLPYVTVDRFSHTPTIPFPTDSALLHCLSLPDAGRPHKKGEKASQTRPQGGREAGPIPVEEAEIWRHAVLCRQGGHEEKT